MKIAIFAYSRRGCITGRQVTEFFAGNQVRAFTMEKYGQPDFEPIEKPSREFYGSLFRWADAMVFVGSIGIAVREIAPHIKSKLVDPAVIDIDELGRFVTPLLSGHIGGGNALALKLATALDSTPVITTATDINQKFSVDAWAARQGLYITDMNAAKLISATILEENIPMQSDFPIVTPLPNGVTNGADGRIGICISCFRKHPFDTTLLLVPPAVHLGIGCRRGTPVENFREAVDLVLAEHNIHPKAIKQVTSINIKSDEAGLLEFCRERKLPAKFYTPEELRAVPGKFTPSKCVLKHTGVDNVCERSAMIGAKELLVRKTIHNGVTVSVAQEPWEVRFE